MQCGRFEYPEGQIRLFDKWEGLLRIYFVLKSIIYSSWRNQSHTLLHLCWNMKGCCGERGLHCPGILLIHEIMQLTSALLLLFTCVCVCVYDDVCMQAAHGSCHGDIRVIGQMLSDARVTGFSRTWYYKSPKLRLCDPFCFSTGFSDSPSFSVFAAAQYAHLVGCKWCAVYLCPCCFWRGDFDCPDMLAVWIMSSLPSGQSV